MRRIKDLSPVASRKMAREEAESSPSDRNREATLRAPWKAAISFSGTWKIYLTNHGSVPAAYALYMAFMPLLRADEQRTSTTSNSLHFPSQSA